MGNLISIIVPAYNAGCYLGECIQSVMAQDYDNWELILIDDGSTDNTYKICLDFTKMDNRICVFRNENHGVSYTRNFGISVANGEYLCFIDADDKILPDYISNLHKNLTEAEADIIFCGCQLLYDNKYIKKTSKIKAGLYHFADLSYRAIDDGTLSGILFGSVWGALYRSSLIKESNIQFDSSVCRNEDGLFNLQLLPYAKKIVVSEYTGYIYRQWGSVSKNHNGFTVSNELNIVSDIIAQRCDFYDDLDKQLKCRELSIIFWNIQKIINADLPIIKLANQLKLYISNTELHKWYHNLNFPLMSKYKKILIGLAYSKQYLLLTILLKYIKPIIKRRLKH